MYIAFNLFKPTKANSSINYVDNKTLPSFLHYKFLNDYTHQRFPIDDNIN